MVVPVEIGAECVVATLNEGKMVCLVCYDANNVNNKTYLTVHCACALIVSVWATASSYGGGASPRG